MRPFCLWALNFCQKRNHVFAADGTPLPTPPTIRHQSPIGSTNRVSAAGVEDSDHEIDVPHQELPKFYTIAKYISTYVACMHHEENHNS